MVESPHPEAQKRFFEADLGHNGFVFLVEGDFFLEVIDDVFVGIGIKDEVEELPEVEVVLANTENLLFLRVFLVLGSEEAGEFVVVVVDIVLVLSA